MATLQSAGILTLLLGLASAFQTPYKHDLDDFMQLMKILEKPRISEVYNKPGLQSFSWKDCGHSSDLVSVSVIELLPEKLKIPGNVTVTASANVSQPMKAPISLSLKVKKKVFVWVDIPCIDGMGSCDYEDACTLIAPIACPPFFPKCHCPVAAGPIKINKETVMVDIPGIPSWLTSGDYEINARAMYEGKEVLCLDMKVALA